MSHILDSLAKTESKDKIKKILKTLNPYRVYEICKFIVETEGDEIDGEVFTYKDEEIIIDYSAKRDKIIFSVEDGEHYRKVLECEAEKIKFLDPMNLWTNLHKLEQKFEKIN